MSPPNKSDPAPVPFIFRFPFRILAWMCWLGVIFFLSHQDARQSGGLTQRLLDWLRSAGVFPERFLRPELAFFLVRKAAHATEYAVLGWLTADVFSRIPLRHWTILSLAFCSVYAASDEFHQSFIPGRGPALTDVGIDTFGALAGILLYALYLRHARKDRN